jgi:hypothetical protein
VSDAQFESALNTGAGWAAPAQVETRGFKDETELKELLGVLVASAGALALFDQPQTHHAARRSWC